MPGWHQATKTLRESGRFRTVGIIQEQHPDRCRLFMQWKQMDWPVLVDSLNLLGVSVVPITLAIDEHGIVRMINPRPNQIEKEFLDRTFDPPAKKAPSAGAQPNDADKIVLSGDSSKLDRAIKLYEQQLQESPSNGDTHFRLGVAHRMRYDSDRRQPNDFHLAVDHWQRALEIDPN